MRNIACAVFFAAVVCAGAGFGSAANARNVCGTNGCAPVFVKRFQVPPRNVTAKAAPLAVFNAPAPAQPALPSLPSLPALPSLSSLPAAALSLFQGK